MHDLCQQWENIYMFFSSAWQCNYIMYRHLAWVAQYWGASFYIIILNYLKEHQIFWSFRWDIANKGSCAVNKLSCLVALARCVPTVLVCISFSALNALLHFVLTQSNQGSANVENVTVKEIKAERCNFSNLTRHSLGRFRDLCLSIEPVSST